MLNPVEDLVLAARAVMTCRETSESRRDRRGRWCLNEEDSLRYGFALNELERALKRVDNSTIELYVVKEKS